MNTESSNERSQRDDLSSPAPYATGEREQRYRTLFATMEEGFCVVEMIFDALGKPTDYRFLEFNSAFQRLTGIRGEDALSGKSAREAYPTLEEFWFETYGRVAITGESIRFENEAAAMGKWFEVHAFRIGGAGSPQVGILFKDISERRLAERERDRLLEEAQSREAFLKLITDRLPVRVGYLDREYRYQFVNGEYERAFGLSTGGGVGLTIAEMAGGEAFRISKPFVDRALAGEAHTQEFSVAYSEGERRIEVQYVPDFDGQRDVRGVVVHVLDVTERFAATEALRQSDERLRIALKGGRMGTWSLDLATQELRCSDTCRANYGRTPQDPFGLEDLFATIVESDRDRWKDAVDRAIGDATDLELEYGVYWPDRSVHYVQIRGSCAFDAQGAVVSLSGVSFDVTDRFQMTEAMREREERYRTLFHAIAEGFCVFEMIFDSASRPVDYRFKEVNLAFEKQTGLRAEDVLGGRTMRELVPNHEQYWFDIYGRVAKTGESIHIEDRAEGLGRWYDIHAFRIGGEGSVEVGALFKDITEEREAERAIEEERARQDRTLETAQVATFDWDVPEDRLHGNPLLNRFFGIDLQEGEAASPERYFGAMHPDDRGRVREAIDGSLQKGDRYEVQYRVTDGEGQERWVLTRGDTVQDLAGQPVRVSGIVFDVTERAHIEAERERLVAEIQVERARLQTLFQMSPSAIAVLRGPELRFEYANEAYHELIGRHSIVGKTLVQALPEIEGQGFVELLQSVLVTGDPVALNEASVLLRSKVGAAVEMRYVNLLYQPIREADDSISGIFVHAIDVTAQVQARHVVGEREELFRTVFEQAPDDAIIVMDADRIITAWNPAAERICGWRFEEAIGQSADLIFTPEDVAKRVPDVETGTAAREGKATDERWHMRRDGSRFWGSGTMNSLHGEDGVVRGFLKVFRDATDRYQETKTLAFLRLLTDTVIDERDPDRIVETVERMLGEYLGASRVVFAEATPDGAYVVVRREWVQDLPGIVGTHEIASFGPQVVADFLSGTTRVFRDSEKDYLANDTRESTEPLGARAGISVPVMKDERLAALVVVHQAQPREWTDDEVGLVRQVADRVTSEIERARAEASLRRSEERFRQLVELSPSTVWFGELDGGLSYISADFYALTGLTPEEALPTGWTSRIHPDDLPVVTADWEAARRKEAIYDTEMRIRARDGEYRWISARALPVRDSEGRVTGWLGSNNDIQERKTIEEALQMAVEERTQELQAAVREAEGFNYSISHDLRTPLRAMVSTSSILLEEAGEELHAEHRELLVRQVENAKRLGQLIDELLRLSRLARVEVNRQTLDLTRKARTIFNELEQHGETSGCHLDVQEGMTAEGDPNLVRTVLYNLIGNACKFSPQGGTIRIRQEGGVFSVADEGVGFDMKFAPKIFLPFERLVLESEFAGTGIGLANVKRIVERHGGRVWVESAPGAGASFFFTLGSL